MKDKQIEEMALALSEGGCGSECDCIQGDKFNCHLLYNASVLYDAGYRKASDVARETVEAIKKEVDKNEQYVSDLYGYDGYVIEITDLENIIRRYMFDTYEEAELKKKYESEGEDRYV